jgi:hypothetical protein
MFRTLLLLPLARDSREKARRVRLSLRHLGRSFAQSRAQDDIDLGFARAVVVAPAGGGSPITAVLRDFVSPW